MEVVRLEGRPEGWAGEWEVSFTDSGGSEMSGVAGWVWTDLELKVVANDGPATETGRGGDGGLVTVKGSPGVTFSRMQVETKARTGDEAARRPVTAEVRQSRIMSEARAASVAGGPTAETAPAPTPLSETLHARVQPPPAEDGPAVLDMEVAASGVDPEGQRFDRAVRANLLRLVPRSTFRRRRSGQRAAHLTPGSVAAIQYDAHGKVLGLVLAHDGKRRAVRVADDDLGRLIADIELQGREFLFAVRGEQLLALVRVLPVDTMRTTVPAEPATGVESYASPIAA